MNQQQLNKIDEEFDIIFTEDKSGKNSIGIQYIDAPRSKLLNFLHSKLQEAYELGRRDEREKVIENLKKGIAYPIRMKDVDCLKDTLKSLQTNKE